ncbi:large conductance mechanosensitive channel protein MscL [Candidatus Saccharibacteria bacterium]|nr:large conductance mechanosensitive channel protein MscL [Candidatus Saccharibacteria bacterium]
MTKSEAVEKKNSKRERAKEAIKTTRERGSGFKKEFVEFINRGSVVDLAVGVAVGGAFTAIVNSLVNDIIMPIVGLIAGGVDFTNLAIRVPNFFGTGDEAVISYGNFLQNVLQFLIIAWVIFMIIKGMNRLNRRRDKKSVEAEMKKAEKKI